MRIVHRADPHLLDLDGVSPWRFANKRLTGWVNLRLKRGNAHRPRLVDPTIYDVRALPSDHVATQAAPTNPAVDSESLAARTAPEVPRPSS